MTKPVVLIVDDEVAVYLSLRNYLHSLDASIDVHIFDDPAEMIAEEPSHATHAFIDLSFARDAEFYRTARARLPSPEVSIGIDAIHYLQTALPNCRVAVVTSLDTELHRAMANAVLDFWPQTPFIHKQDFRFLENCQAFVSGDTVFEVPEFRLFLDRPTTPIELRALMDERAIYKEAAIRLLVTLADFVFVPTVSELAAATGKGHQNIKAQLRDIKSWLRGGRQVQTGGEIKMKDVWAWARARRPILAELLGQLSDRSN